MSVSSFSPVPVTERADILDAIRGIAILGIFLNNINGFSGYIFLNEEYKKLIPTYAVDNVLSFLQHVFVEGKFYSIFSLLFGIGFSIILTKNAQKGIGSLRIFYRRLLVLMIIGLIHCYFLWDGDILLLYALIGMVLPLFRNCGDKTLLIWALSLIVSPLFIDLIKVLLQWSPGDFILNKAQAIDVKNGIPIDDTYALYLYKEGSGLQEWHRWRESGIFYRYQYILDSNRIPKVLGMFLLGFYAGRKRIYQRLQEYRGLFKKLRLWGFVVGLPASVAMVYFLIDGRNVYKSPYGLLDALFYAISVVPLSLAYVSSMCLFWIKRKEENFLRVFAPAGRMALTNYILQTVAGIIIFYGVGFGLGTRFGPSYIFPIAIGIFILQTVLSTYWLKYFRYGPVEWLWRQLTYGKRLAFRK